jgi:3-methyladenine DNA glycosylase AlkD
MSQAEDIYLEIHNYCVSNANDELVKKYSRYFKGGYDAWGLPQELFNSKNKELTERGVLNYDLIFQIAPLLMKTGKYEETSFAITMLMSLSKGFDKSVFKRLESWFTIGIHNWAHADYLGMTVLPMFIKNASVNVDDFIPWISSEFKFQRRCVPVTFIKSIKDMPINKLLDIIEPLMHDSEREVHQGVGWFLREAWKIHPEEIERFLLKYKNSAPRLIFQYACEKMKPEQKAKFKKEK